MKSAASTLALVLLTALCGCDGCRKSPPIAMLADAAPPPRFDKPASQPDPRFTSDAFWTQAAEGDPLDLATLADREGAPGLLEGFEQGGKIGHTALVALPYADDAELAYRRLGEVALQTKDDTQYELIDIVRRIAQDTKARGEPLDPGGAEVCIEALTNVASGSGPKRNRVHAATALRAFANRGALDPAKIPAVD